MSFYTCRDPRPSLRSCTDSYRRATEIQGFRLPQKGSTSVSPPLSLQHFPPNILCLQQLPQQKFQRLYWQGELVIPDHLTWLRHPGYVTPSFSESIQIAKMTQQEVIKSSRVFGTLGFLPTWTGVQIMPCWSSYKELVSSHPHELSWPSSLSIHTSQTNTIRKNQQNRAATEQSSNDIAFIFDCLMPSDCLRHAFHILRAEVSGI